MAKPSKTNFDGAELRGVISADDTKTATDGVADVSKARSSNVHSKHSKATEVFNIFELAEMILDRLPFEDIVQAQRICRATRDVIAETPRFRTDHIVYEPGLWLARRPFCQINDFCVSTQDATGSGWLYLLGNHSACHFDAGGDETGVMRLFYDLSDQPHPDWKVDEDGDILCDRTIIIPYPPSNTTESPSLPPYQDLQLWHDVAWTSKMWGREEIMVEIVLRSKCNMGHAAEDRMFFEPGATLGWTVAWLRYFIECWPAKLCPGGEPSFCHRRRFHLEGDTLHARTTDGVEGQKVTDKPNGVEECGSW